MNLITTENEIELNAMKIADQNHYQALRIKHQWRKDCLVLLEANRKSENLYFDIMEAVSHIAYYRTRTTLFIDRD